MVPRTTGNVEEKRRVGVTAVVRYPLRSGQEIEELAERG